jgi:hypothetical protein
MPQMARQNAGCIGDAEISGAVTRASNRTSRLMPTPDALPGGLSAVKQDVLYADRARLSTEIMPAFTRPH